MTRSRTAPNPFWTPAVERCAIRWNPAQHRPHYPACRPPTSACGSKSKLHALASCCGLRVRCLVSMPGRHERLHHHRRPARARRRENGRGPDSPSTRYIVGMIQKTIRSTRTTSFSTTTRRVDGPWKRCGPSGKDFRRRVITSWSDPGRRGRMGKRDVITLEVLNSADEWVTRDEV